MVDYAILISEYIWKNKNLSEFYDLIFFLVKWGFLFCGCLKKKTGIH